MSAQNEKVVEFLLQTAEKQAVKGYDVEPILELCSKYSSKSKTGRGKYEFEKHIFEDYVRNLLLKHKRDLMNRFPFKDSKDFMDFVNVVEDTITAKWRFRLYDQ